MQAQNDSQKINMVKDFHMYYKILLLYFETVSVSNLLNKFIENLRILINKQNL